MPPDVRLGSVQPGAAWTSLLRLRRPGRALIIRVTSAASTSRELSMIDGRPEPHSTLDGIAEQEASGG
jgi:hypothetical protein